MDHLLLRRLPDIHHRQTLQMTITHLAMGPLPGQHRDHRRLRSPAAVAIARPASLVNCRTTSRRFASGKLAHTGVFSVVCTLAWGRHRVPLA